MNVVVSVQFQKLSLKPEEENWKQQQLQKVLQKFKPKYVILFKVLVKSHRKHD